MKAVRELFVVHLSHLAEEAVRLGGMQGSGHLVTGGAWGGGQAALRGRSRPSVPPWCR